MSENNQEVEPKFVETVEKEKPIRKKAKKADSQKIIANEIETGIGEPRSNLDGRFLHVRVGDINSPATDDEIKRIQTQLENVFENAGINCVVYVSHHAVDIKIIG